MVNRDFKTLKQLLSLFRLHPWAMPTIIALGILSSLSEGFGISLFIPFLHGLEQPAFHPDTGNWLADALASLFTHIPPDRRLMVIAACIFGSILFKALLSFSASALLGWLEMRITHRLRSSIFEKLLKVEYRFIEQSPSGKLFNTLSTETWRTSDALSTLVELIISVCMIGVYATLLLLISWKLTLLVLAFMIMVSMVIRALTLHVKDLSTDLTNANALFSKRMVQAVDGMKVVRAFGREAYEQGRFDKVSERISRLVMKLIVAAGLVNPVYEILGGALLLYVLFTTLQTPSGLTPLLVFIFVLYRLQPKIKELDEQRVKLSSLSASVEDVMSLLDHTARFCPGSGKVSISRLKKGIRFDCVSFHYSASERPALKDVSIFVAPGKTTAFVGPSGGGKSTLIKLILRLYNPTGGDIFADDQPLQELDLALWRKRITLVSQDVYLFDATVKENIAYGRLGATAEEIVEAARQADAHGFISLLPDGYDTELGERGVRLSGGQQQRISMARAFLRKPEILILDEPTSVLDTLSERLIQDALDKLREDCTVIVIAHRLSTIKQADHIIVLEEGRVCEQGDLHQLLARKGLFARLYELQFPRDMA
ncbi:MAG: ATP-binding cassette, subfamily bacterial MsbA [Thermodesulfobacteriota bacterium]|nr:ATP-binding cassette, subfamily bacterial MsbA [Thermodesulfobacteriota bacterium]